MSTRVKVRKRTRRKEVFHTNEVVCAGRVKRVWNWSGNVFARLAIPQRGGDQNETDPHDYVTLLFPPDLVDRVTIGRGDIVRAKGYLVDYPYLESGRQFLDKVRKPRFIDDLPEEVLNITINRVATYVALQEMIPISADQFRAGGRQG